MPSLGDRKPAIPRAGQRLRRAFAAALAVSLAPLPAPATDFRVGELEGIFDVSLTHGLLARVEGRDSDLIGIGNGDRDHTGLGGDAEDLVGSGGEIQDYYLSGRFKLRGIPLQLRLGNQVLNWGPWAGSSRPTTSSAATGSDPREFSPNALAYYIR